MGRKGIKNPVVNPCSCGQLFFTTAHKEFNAGKNSFPTKGFGTIAMDFISLKDKQTFFFLEVSIFYFLIGKMSCNIL